MSECFPSFPLRWTRQRISLFPSWGKKTGVFSGSTAADQWKDQHPDCCLGFSTTGQNILETLKDAGTNSLQSQSAQTSGRPSSWPKKGRKGKREGSHPATSFAGLRAAAWAPLAEGRPSAHQDSYPLPPTKAAHKFLRCPSPALYSSPEPWILQKAGWSYLCPINAHLNLKTLFQQRSLLLLRPEISLDCTGYSRNSSRAKPCCSPTPARPSDRQPFRVPVHQRVPSGS